MKWNGMDSEWMRMGAIEGGSALRTGCSWRATGRRRSFLRDIDATRVLCSPVLCCTVRTPDPSTSASTIRDETRRYETRTGTSSYQLQLILAAAEAEAEAHDADAGAGGHETSSGPVRKVVTTSFPLRDGFLDFIQTRHNSAL